MISKLRLGLVLLKIKRVNHRSGKIVKKNRKMPDRFEKQWRFDWLLKKSNKILKKLKIKVKITNYNKLPKSNFVIAANHQSMLDPLVLISSMKKQTADKETNNRQFVFLAKKELSENKKIKNAAEVIDSIFIDRENPRQALQKMKELAEHLKENPGLGVVIFPEGTRSKNGELGKFKGGAFSIARKNFIPIIPCTINNSATFMNRKRNWMEIEVIFHKPLKPLKFIRMSSQDLANHVREIISSKFIKPEQINKNLEEKV